jgi:hypothetical protein
LDLRNCRPPKRFATGSTTKPSTSATMEAESMDTIGR